MPERVAPAKRNGGSQQPDWVLSEAGIFNQLTLDQIADQVSIKEFVDPFTGNVNQKA